MDKMLQDAERAQTERMKKEAMLQARLAVKLYPRMNPSDALMEWGKDEKGSPSELFRTYLQSSPVNLEARTPAELDTILKAAGITPVLH